MSITYKLAEKRNALMFFRSTYRINNPEMKRFNNYKILCDEIVSFDCGLFQLEEVLYEEILSPTSDFQYLAVIIDPSERKSDLLSEDDRFSFVGYDLVEDLTSISAITNCGGDFEKAIDYDQLNDFGLFSDFAKALETREKLAAEYPDENHADCEIVEIWRYAHDR